MPNYFIQNSSAPAVLLKSFLCINFIPVAYFNNNNNENEKLNQANLNVYNGNPATGIHIVQIFLVVFSSILSFSSFEILE